MGGGSDQGRVRRLERTHLLEYSLGRGGAGYTPSGHVQRAIFRGCVFASREACGRGRTPRKIWLAEGGETENPRLHRQPGPSIEAAASPPLPGGANRAASWTPRHTGPSVTTSCWWQANSGCIMAAASRPLDGVARRPPKLLAPRAHACARVCANGQQGLSGRLRRRRRRGVERRLRVTGHPFMSDCLPRTPSTPPAPVRSPLRTGCNCRCASPYGRDQY